MKNEKITKNEGVNVGIVKQTYDIITRFYAKRELVDFLHQGNQYGFRACFKVPVNTGREVIPAGKPVSFHHSRQLGGCSNLLIIVD